MQRRLLQFVLCYSISFSLSAAELVHQFQSPSFIPGNGYSSHVLTIEQLESQRKKAIKDAEKAAADAEARAKANTNLAKFLVNVESRIYAQLSKQLADNMFAEGSGSTGSFDFQGTSISWVKSSTEVTLTIIETNGNRTDITVPIAAFAYFYSY
jgi:curli production assembly/transport component CsgF